MRQKSLTLRQETVLGFVEDYLAKKGFPPTLREIGEAVGLVNINAVRSHLLAIEKKGYISKAPERARSIQILRSSFRMSRLKRKMHELLKTDEGVIHHVIYGLGWTTYERQPFLKGEAKDLMLAAFHKEAKEGGWKILQEEIRPKDVFLVVKVWPNHSAELVVRRFQRAGTRMKRHNPDSFPGKDLWGRGYMASTSVELMTEMSEHIAVQKQV